MTQSRYATDLTTILTQPIPDQTEARNKKYGYREYPLLSSGPHAHEPLVDIAQFGVAGQSYYSRSNSVTGGPVPGIDPGIRVRKSLAERLVLINHALQNSQEVAELFGRPVELYVNEGYRSAELQRKLYHEVFPRLIVKQHPHYDEQQVFARRDELIASPEGDTPSPHNTGAAVDIALRYMHPDTGYVRNAQLPMGRGKTSVSAMADPDYFEHNKGNVEHQHNRRILYWIMRGALIHDDSGLVVNPTEWWHWSYGDQLWATLTQAPCAFFDSSDE